MVDMAGQFDLDATSLSQDDRENRLNRAILPAEEGCWQVISLGSSTMRFPLMVTLSLNLTIRVAY